MPTLRTASPTAQGIERKWSSVDAFSQEVALARIVGGVRYRYSTDTGRVMGRQIGKWALVFSPSAEREVVADNRTVE